MRLIQTAVLALACTYASASDWRIYDQGEGGDRSYDADSIFRAPNGTIQVWIKTNFATTDQLAGQPAEIYFSKLQLYGLDCPQRAVALLQDLKYKGANVSGKLLDSWVNQAPSTSYSSPAPDTVGETVWKLFCRDLKKTPPSRRKE